MDTLYKMKLIINNGKICYTKKPDKNSENNIKKNIINGRIRHLENEIKNFEKQIKDLSNKN